GLSHHGGLPTSSGSNDQGFHYPDTPTAGDFIAVPILIHSYDTRSTGVIHPLEKPCLPPFI
ncbi:MAG TPA: hypothetical protein VII93_06365, partial [Anaerolineales bacterium]